MIEIDLAKAHSLVDECIAERGADYEYLKEGSSCKYVHGVKYQLVSEYTSDYDFSEATPGCVVGLALNKAGVKLSFMGRSGRNDTGSDDLITSLVSRGMAEVDNEARAFLNNMQASQDRGAPWGLAREAALKGMTLEKKYDYTKIEPEHVGWFEVSGVSASEY